MHVVGRERELGRLGAALERASGGQLARVAVTGATGSGVSTLLAEMERRLADEPDVVVVRGAAFEPLSGHPYAALSAALRGPVSAVPGERLPEVLGPAAGEIALLLPELAETIGATCTVDAPMISGPDRRRGRFVEMVLGVLGRLAAGGTVLLALDDLHAADPGTRAFVEFVLGLDVALPICLVVSYHQDELGRRHPFARVASMLAENDAVDRIELGPLRPDELLRVIEAETGERPTAGLLAAIVERSGGNPLMAEQLLAARRFVPGARLSDSFEELLESRIGALGAGAARWVRALSALRRPAEPAMLAGLRLPDGILREDAVAEAVGSGLVALDGGQARVAQELYAETVEELLDPRGRQAVHAAIAEWLPGPPAEQAWHWERALRLDRARDAHVAAGLAAEALDPGGTALGHFLRALELDALRPTVPASPAAGLDRAALLARAADAAYVGGAFRRASTLAARAIEAELDPAALARVGARGQAARAERATELASLHARLGRYRWAAGEIDEALSAFRTGVQLLPREPSVARARVIGALAQALMLAGRFEESASWAREAIGDARAAGEAALAELGHATCTLGVDDAYLGDLEGGLARIREASTLARRAGRLDDLMRCYANLTTLLDLGSRRAEALAVVDEGIAEAARWGQEAVYGAFLRGNGGDTLFALGRWAESEAMCHQALEWSPSGVARFNPLLWLTSVRVESAADEEAGRLLGQLLLQQESVADPQGAADVERVTVSFALWREDVQDARRAAERGWVAVLQSDDWAQIARGAATTVEAAAAVADDARERRDATTVQEALAWADAVLAEAERRLASGGVPPVPGVRREADLNLATARAHRSRIAGPPDPAAWADLAERWMAIPNPYRAAHARWREAEAVLRSRPATPGARVDRARAGAALQESWRIAEALGARPLRRELARLAARARIQLPVSEDAAQGRAAGREEGVVGGPRRTEARPGLAQRLSGAGERPPSDPFSLTSRELEVLGVLAEGRTNREIAHRLFISERTVAVHVRNILAKLRVSGRVEAATVALRLGLGTAASPSGPRRP
jgi:DNA-binding CsgD family transcriptional regulator/tetratricopeptide (TPR) repeat protein